jgi:hypothetical protein
MYIEQVTLDVSGTATIVAETPDPESEWKYRSGAFNSVAWIICNDQYPEWDIRGEFQAPTARGAWPAFWPTGAWGWPPEIDILEYKGDTLNWFNTYDGGWETKKVRVANAATAWHEYRCHLTRLDGTQVMVEFYLDGALKATHTGSNFVGQPFDLIVNLQMEGSSGSPGPTGPTYYYARNIVVQRYAAPVPPGPLGSDQPGCCLRGYRDCLGLGPQSGVGRKPLHRPSRHDGGRPVLPGRHESDGMCLHRYGADQRRDLLLCRHGHGSGP